MRIFLLLFREGGEEGAGGGAGRGQRNGREKFEEGVGGNGKEREVEKEMEGRRK